MILAVRHQLYYTYDQPVVLNRHTLYLFPRTYPYQRLLDYKLTIDPKPQNVVRNVDIEGNVQQLVYFNNNRTDHLSVTAEMQLESAAVNSLDFVLFPFETQQIPFAYPESVRSFLEPYLEHRSESISYQVTFWAKQLADQVKGNTVSFLILLNQTIRQFTYEIREQGAPYAPEETLLNRRGSCRDYTILYIAACRSLGLAARFVSGYLSGNGQQEHELHSWAEVYLPGAGWRGFDPTENLVVMNQYIFLASSAHAELTTPVRGLFGGEAQSVLTATVEILSNDDL